VVSAKTRAERAEADGKKYVKLRDYNYRDEVCRLKEMEEGKVEGADCRRGELDLLGVVNAVSPELRKPSASFIGALLDGEEAFIGAVLDGDTLPDEPLAESPMLQAQPESLQRHDRADGQAGFADADGFNYDARWEGWGGGRKSYSHIIGKIVPVLDSTGTIHNTGEVTHVSTCGSRCWVVVCESFFCTFNYEGVMAALETYDLGEDEGSFEARGGGELPSHWTLQLVRPLYVMVCSQRTETRMATTKTATLPLLPLPLGHLGESRPVLQTRASRPRLLGKSSLVSV